LSFGARSVKMRTSDVPHGAVVSQGYPSVYVNGERLAYVGATVTCPSNVVGTGRPSVLVGEGDKIRL
jgi:uncharacterized Zn-binding protein involved in type VI secretion